MAVMSCSFPSTDIRDNLNLIPLPIFLLLYLPVSDFIRKFETELSQRK